MMHREHDTMAFARGNRFVGIAQAVTDRLLAEDELSPCADRIGDNLRMRVRVGCDGHQLGLLLREQLHP